MHNISSQREINAYKLKLRPVMQSDLEQLRQWRNSPEIRKNMLSQTIISTEQQKKWFKTLCLQRENKQETERTFHFVVEYKGRSIGYANFIAADKMIESAKDSDTKPENGQTSLYIGETKYRGTILAFCLALALLDFVFLEYGETELDAVVLTHNLAALRFNEKLGYQIQSKEQDIIKMHLTKEHYLQAKQELEKIIRI